MALNPELSIGLQKIKDASCIDIGRLIEVFSTDDLIKILEDTDDANICDHCSRENDILPISTMIRIIIERMNQGEQINGLKWKDEYWGLDGQVLFCRDMSIMRGFENKISLQEHRDTINDPLKRQKYDENMSKERIWISYQHWISMENEEFRNRLQNIC